MEVFLYPLIETLSAPHSAAMHYSSASPAPIITTSLATLE